MKKIPYLLLLVSLFLPLVMAENTQVMIAEFGDEQLYGAFFGDEQLGVFYPALDESRDNEGSAGSVAVGADVDISGEEVKKGFPFTIALCFVGLIGLIALIYGIKRCTGGSKWM